MTPAFNKTNVRIYPNPVANGKLTVKIIDGFEGSTSVTVFDISGRIYYLSPIEKSETVIDVSGFKSGLYITKISNSNIFYSYKLLVK